MITLGDENVPNGFDHDMRSTPAHWECLFYTQIIIVSLLVLEARIKIARKTCSTNKMDKNDPTLLKKPIKLVI